MLTCILTTRVRLSHIYVTQAYGYNYVTRPLHQILITKVIDLLFEFSLVMNNNHELLCEMTEVLSFLDACVFVHHATVHPSDLVHAPVENLMSKPNILRLLRML